MLRVGEEEEGRVRGGLGKGETHLPLKVDGCAADEVAFIVGFLHCGCGVGFAGEHLCFSFLIAHRIPCGLVYNPIEYQGMYVDFNGDESSLSAACDYRTDPVHTQPSKVTSRSLACDVHTPECSAGFRQPFFSEQPIRGGVILVH